MANIILDDTQLSYKLGGGTWSTVNVYRFFGGSAIWPAFATATPGSNGPYGWISFQFEGTGISIVGNTPSPPADQSFSVSIDGGSPTSLTYGDPSPPTSMQWYKSNSLSSGTHSINITHLAGASVDFVTIALGNDTPLSGQTIIVDDQDSSIAYTGSWSQVSKEYTSRENPHQGWPYLKGTTRATSAGPTATFRFTGTAVSVYGLYNYQQLGSLVVKYTLDGASTTVDYSITTSNANYKAGFQERENTVMFSNNNLSGGDHTLLIEVVTCSGQDFALDYITYKPSFATLSAKPSLSNSPATSGGSSSVGGGGISPPAGASTVSSGTQSSGQATNTISDPAGVGVTVSGAASTNTASGGGSSNGSSSGDQNAAASSHKSNTAAIAGGVVGGVIILLLLALAFVFWKRRKQRAEVAEYEKEIPSTVEPFTGSTYATAGGSTVTGFTRDAKPIVASGAASGYSRQDSSPPATDSYRSESPLLIPNRAPVSREKAALAAAAAALAASETSSNTGADPQLLSRMQRLQDLVTELNSELLHGGDNNPRVPELRGRIAELARADSESALYVAAHLRQSAVPPPYETA